MSPKDHLESTSISISCTNLKHLIRSLAVEVYKCLHNIAPEYLCTLLQKLNVTYELRDKN